MQLHFMMSFTEDLANHLEDYLYDSNQLQKKFPKRYELIKNLVGENFKMESP